MVLILVVGHHSAVDVATAAAVAMIVTVPGHAAHEDGGAGSGDFAVPC